jgi:hypothetical protein
MAPFLLQGPRCGNSGKHKGYNMHSLHSWAAHAPQDFPHHRHPPKQRRHYSIEQWTRLRDQVDREHRVVAHADPRSPRVRPTLASFLTREGAQ